MRRLRLSIFPAASSSKGLPQQPRQGPPPPGKGRSPTRDLQSRATPCTEGDKPEMEVPQADPVSRAESVHKDREGLRPRYARQWFRPALAAPRGGVSSFPSDFTRLKQRPGLGPECRRMPGGGTTTDCGEVGFKDSQFLSPPNGLSHCIRSDPVCPLGKAGSK